MSNLNSIVTLNELSKSFQEGRKERLVLDKITEQFAEGAFTVLLGRSGSGKSTLLNLISGIEVPTTERTIKANIRVGNAIRMSTQRLSSWSTQPPTVAAKKPHTIPTIKESAVIRNAMAIVLRAP